MTYAGAYAQDEWAVEGQPEDHRGHPRRRPELRRHGLHEQCGRCADVPRRGRTGRAVPDRQAARRETAVVAARRLQLGVDEQRNTQVRGGTGVFTGRPAYVWISNQIGNTGVLTGFQQFDNTIVRPFNPESGCLQAVDGDGRAGVVVRARADRPGLQVPAVVAHQHRRRPAPAVRPDRHRGVHLQPRRQRRVLHQRQPPGRAVGVHRGRQRARAGRPTGSTQQRLQRRRPQEPGHRPFVELRRHAGEELQGRLPEGRLQLRRGQEHGRSRFHRVRVVEQQPARGRPEQSRARLLRRLAGSPLLRRRLLHVRVPRTSASRRCRSSGSPGRNGSTSYTFSRRSERRRRHEQRPDLHPARHVGDELPDLQRGRPDVHGGRAGRGVRRLHRPGPLPEREPRAATPNAAPSSCPWSTASTSA